MTERKAVRLRKSRVVHASDADYAETLCSLPLTEAVLDADQIPTCKRCLRILAKN